jgi:hypothetical protein
MLRTLWSTLTFSPDSDKELLFTSILKMELDMDAHKLTL